MSEKFFNSLDFGPQVSDEIVRRANQDAASSLSPHLDYAPPAVEEWVGRQESLAVLDYSWLDDRTYVVGLIGLGGEGKSSLARRWLDDIWQDEILANKPDGVFWWDCYKRRNIDEFFREALIYFSKGRVNPQKLPSADAQAKFLAGMLKNRCYLLILDGLEQEQYQSGEDYGFLKSLDMSSFLNYFASGNHQSFCLITSRVRVMDLMSYVTYENYNVDRLSNNEGQELLEKLGVKGTKSQLEELVERWDGHALTLSLLGKYLVEFHQGNLDYADYFDPSLDQDNRSTRISKMLQQYDEILTSEQQEFMMQFSAFRYPVSSSAIKKLFKIDIEEIDRLVEYRILSFSKERQDYFSHALIRSYYVERLKKNPQQEQAVNQRIADYYLEISPETSSDSTLENLRPLIEAVRHLCRATHFDEADNLRTENLAEPLEKLGAYETYLNLLLEFFIKDSIESKVSTPGRKRDLIHEVGQCLGYLGRLFDCLPYYNKYIQLAEEDEALTELSRGHRELARTYTYLGQLERGKIEAHKALDIANNINDTERRRKALVYLGYIAFLSNDKEKANQIFEDASELEVAEDWGSFYFGDLGVIYADYFRRVGEYERAYNTIQANLNLTKQQSRDDLSRIYRAMGNLEADAGHHANASKSFQESLDIARSITHWPALISILSERGRWLAKDCSDPQAAFSNLNEALDHSKSGKYLIYEADVRVGLAWAYMRANNLDEAKRQAKWAKVMSEEIKYHWGQEDAKDVLKDINEAQNNKTTTEKNNQNQFQTEIKMNFDPQLIAKLTALLRPQMRSQQERNAILVQALGTDSPLLYQLELSGGVDAFITGELLPKLKSFGEVEPGKPAIVALLEAIKPQVGVDKQVQIDDLIQEFNSSKITTTLAVGNRIDGDSREIFISYAWGGESEELVNRLDAVFQEKGISIVRDKKDAGYKASIKEFMERIGQGKAIIVVISDRYLKSENCMFELLKIFKNGQFRDRIFPVVLKDAQIYKPVPRLQYIKHWEEQITELDTAMKGVSAANLQGFRDAIDLYTEIRQTIAELVDILSDMNALTPQMHQESNFEQLLEAIKSRVLTLLN